MNTISTIKVGDIIRTNYNTGPYRVVSVCGPFTEPSFVDSLNMGKDAPKSPPHFSYVCEQLDSKRRNPFYLNGYDGVTHKNVWRNSDRIITLDEDSLLTLIALN